jgi:hypothetical protein
MDVSSVIEAARCPLTIDEIKKFCGPMWDGERFESLLRSGEIGLVPGTKDIYWCIPPALRKRSSQSRKCVSPATPKQRSSEIKKTIELRNKINTISAEYETLKERSKDLPTEEETKQHIERLHKLNEARDEGVKIIEKLAQLNGTNVHPIYEKFEIDEEMLK